jgi:hypothetical protein
MSHRLKVGWALGVGGLLVIVAGCWSGKPSRVHPPAIDASAAGAKAIEMYDTNHDGKISGAELEKCPAFLKAPVLARFDASGKGAVTAEAIADRIKKWQESRVGLTSITCTIKRNGQPLAGAEVRLVPEKFLGDQIRPAKGTSDDNGVVPLTVYKDDGTPNSPPGVALGLYRVVVTKPGMEIPKKYSSEEATVLGTEVAHDVDETEGNLIFDLQF